MLITEFNTDGNKTHANITGLQSGMLIQIQVAGVSRVGDFIAKGPLSDSIQLNISNSPYDQFNTSATGKICVPQ